MYYLVELSLRNAIAVINDPGGLETGGLVELDEQLPHHGCQVLDDVLTVLLDPHCSTVAAGVGVHTTDHLGEEKHMYAFRFYISPHKFCSMASVHSNRNLLQNFTMRISILIFS